MRSFAYPYFSRDIAEFWRRWHISLSTWFRDYLYIPLGGSRGGTWMKIRNTFVIFIVSGFWHGANWTFIVWGALNAIYFLPLLFTNRNRSHLDIIAQGKYFPSIREFLGMSLTFGLTVVAWIFFRAENIGHAFQYLKGIFTASLFNISLNDIREISNGSDMIYLVAILLAFVLAEWIQRDKQHALQFHEEKSPALFRRVTYLLVAFLIFWFQGSQQVFIYFQF